MYFDKHHQSIPTKQLDIIRLATAIWGGSSPQIRTTWAPSIKYTSRVTWGIMDPLRFESKFLQYGNYVRKNKYCYVFINFNTIQIYAFDYVNIHCFFHKSRKKMHGSVGPQANRQGYVGPPLNLCFTSIVEYKVQNRHVYKH